MMKYPLIVKSVTSILTNTGKILSLTNYPTLSLVKYTPNLYHLYKMAQIWQLHLYSLMVVDLYFAGKQFRFYL